ncbi:MAG: hypothetical protein ACRCW3_00535, partial [Metamycoplasmataceae bacterium]
FNKEFGDQRSGKKRVEYLKEATVVMDVRNNKGTKVEDIIGAVTKKIGSGKLLAVRPKNSLEYELTLTCAEDCDDLVEGVEIKGQLCGVRRLELKECVVSFIHLPAYVEDETIEEKLRLWGVTPITEIKRRRYPGTDIADGTRYVKVNFPKEVTSLPYSAKFETSDGERYFRVIHDGQIKLCRMCLQPGHILKDCPDFKCFKCAGQGHFAKDCRTNKCLDCNKVLSKCDCETEREEHQSEEETETGAVGSPRVDLEVEKMKETDGLNSKDCNEEFGEKNETGKEKEDGMGKMEGIETEEDGLNENVKNVCSVLCVENGRSKEPEKELMDNVNILEAVGSKEIEKEPLCNVKVDEMEYEKEVKKGDEDNCKSVKKQDENVFSKRSKGKENGGKKQCKVLIPKDTEKESEQNNETVKEKGKENGGKNQCKVHHVLGYKKIPNLNLVLKKQKIRRSDVKKNKGIVNRQLRTEFGWSSLME